MGHEFMGEIVETGSAVTTLKKGDRIVSAFTTSWYVANFLFLFLEMDCTCSNLQQWQVLLLHARLFFTLREEYPLWL